jgi:hypothetical protein
MSEFEFRLDGPIDLSCRLNAGSLVIHAEPGREVAQVTVEPRDPRADVLSRSTVELRGSQLIVHVPDEGSNFGHNGRRDEAELTVRVPAGTPMRLAAGSADVTVHGRSGAMDLRTGSSTIVLDEIEGELSARTGSGDLRARLVTGAATCKGGSGDVEIDRVGGDLTVTVGSGDLRLGSTGGTVRLRSGSGTADIGSLSHDADLTSGSGAMTVGLAAGVHARLDVRTGSGEVRTEMPLEHSAGSGPAIRLRARTGSGDVTVRRAVIAEAPVS